MKVKISAVKRVVHNDLKEKYENPIVDACSIGIGSVFISNDGEMPEGFCKSAWESVGPYVERLAKGEENFFNGWMKNKKSAMISCNDGFRPVSFYLEVI